MDGNTHRMLPNCWRVSAGQPCQRLVTVNAAFLVLYISTAISVAESLYLHGVASNRFLSEDTLDWGCRPRAEIGGIVSKLVILTLILTIF